MSPCAKVFSCLTATILLAACDPLTLTVAGVGASAGVQHTMTGIVTRTLAAPLPDVRDAARSALTSMDIKINGRYRIWTGEEFQATAGGREISVKMEALTAKTTRVEVTARNGLLYDAATATEIVNQTEKALAVQTAAAATAKH